MRFSIQFFLLGIALIRCISLQAKTTLFVGQNLNAKTTLIFGMEGVYHWIDIDPYI
jgi:hypothetical protein